MNHRPIRIAASVIDLRLDPFVTENGRREHSLERKLFRMFLHLLLQLVLSRKEGKRPLDETFLHAARDQGVKELLAIVI